MLTLLLNPMMLNSLKEFFLTKKKETNSSRKRLYHDEFTSSSIQNQDMESRRGKRMKIQKNFGPDFISFLTEDEPQTYKEAMSSP